MAAQRLAPQRRHVRELQCAAGMPRAAGRVGNAAFPCRSDRGPPRAAGGGAPVCADAGRWWRERARGRRRIARRVARDRGRVGIANCSTTISPFRTTPSTSAISPLMPADSACVTWPKRGAHDERRRHDRGRQSVPVRASPCRTRTVPGLFPVTPLSPVVAGAPRRAARSCLAPCAGSDDACGGRSFDLARRRARSRSLRANSILPEAEAARCARYWKRSLRSRRRALPIAALPQESGTNSPGRPLTAMLTDAFVSGIVTLHVHPPRLVREAVPNRRRARSPGSKRASANP